MISVLALLATVVGVVLWLTYGMLSTAQLMVLSGAWGALAFPLNSVAVANTNDFAEDGEYVMVSAGLLLMYGLGAIIGPSLAAGAMTLMGDPEIVFLDEPTTGLDPRSRRAVWRILRDLVADGVTIFLTTHYLEEADRLADRVALLDHGRLIAEGSPVELKRLIPGGHVRSSAMRASPAGSLESR